jgi:hypothetical protein
MSVVQLYQLVTGEKSVQKFQYVFPKPRLNRISIQGELSIQTLTFAHCLLKQLAKASLYHKFGALSAEETFNTDLPQR